MGSYVEQHISAARSRREGARSAHRDRSAWVGCVWSLASAFALLASVGLGQAWLAVAVLAVGALLTVALLRGEPSPQPVVVALRRNPPSHCLWDPNSEA